MPIDNSTLVTRLDQLERPISEGGRASLLSELMAYPTYLDDLPTGKRFGRGDYSSFLTPLYLAAASVGLVPTQVKLTPVKEYQACFVKGLDDYLNNFPKNEAKMRQIFEDLFRVGTSAYWEADSNLILELSKVSRTIEDLMIKPWVAEEDLVRESYI